MKLPNSYFIYVSNLPCGVYQSVSVSRKQFFNLVRAYAKFNNIKIEINSFTSSIPIYTFFAYHGLYGSEPTQIGFIGRCK